jgi:site-specific DNA-methyltransferase (adenine-specific)
MILPLLQCLDNLVFLQNLPSESIDLIYNDILYGTGRDFGDYKDLPHSFDEQSKFYLPRFIEMHRVLKSSGTIYIHTGVKNSHWIRSFLDQVFGNDQFRNEIIWYYNSAPRKEKDFGNRHDVIFRYSKTSEYYFNPNSSYIREPYSDTAPRGYEKEKYYNPLGKVKGDVWSIKILGQNDKTERVNYSTQKPLELLAPIIDSSCPPGGVVADFFCGSGTTLVAAQKLGRQIIGCDINLNAIEITKERLSKFDSQFLI